MGVEWGGSNERPRKPKKEPKGRWLGGDPANGYASVGQMPGAPGINDEAIFAAQRARNLSPQQFKGDQFDLDDPYEADLAKQHEAASEERPLTMQQSRWMDPDYYGDKKR